MFENGPNTDAWTGWESILPAVGHAAVALDTRRDSIRVVFRQPNRNLFDVGISPSASALNGNGRIVVGFDSTIGGAGTSDPVIGASSDGSLIAVVRGLDYGAWINRQDSDGVWRSENWRALGGTIYSKIGVALDERRRMRLIARGRDNRLWSRAQPAPNADFGDWEAISSPVYGDPTVAVNQDGTLELFTLGFGGEVRHFKQGATGIWSELESLGGIVSGAVSASPDGFGKMHVFAAGADGTLYFRRQLAANQSSPESAWTPWTAIGGQHLT